MFSLEGRCRPVALGRCGRCWCDAEVGGLTRNMTKELILLAPRYFRANPIADELLSPKPKAGASIAADDATLVDGKAAGG
jgi:hypothetical protein